MRIERLKGALFSTLTVKLAAIFIVASILVLTSPFTKSSPGTHDATVSMVPVNSKAGENIGYTLTVTNASGDNIDNVTLEIPLDEGGNARYRVAIPIPAPENWTSELPENDGFGYARKIRWWTDNAWAHIAAGNSENFTFTATTPLYDGVYTWMCRTRDVSGYLDSNSFTTRVDNVPPDPPPTLVWPDNDENINDNTPNLDWNPVTDSSMPVTYDLTVTCDQNFEWWNENWLKRRPITINGTHPENYQIKIVIPYDNDMRSDYGDLRFLENKAAGLLSYWIENYTADNVTVWVRRLENADNTIYVYYSNPSVTSAENADATFLLYDDFPGTSVDTNKWDVVTSGTGEVSVSNSELKLKVNANADDAKIEAKSAYTFGPYNMLWEARIKSEHANGGGYAGLHETNVLEPNQSAFWYYRWWENSYYRSENLSGWSSYAVGDPGTAYRIWKVWTVSSSLIKFWRDESSWNKTDYVPTVAMRPWIEIQWPDGWSASPWSSYTDWIRVRKYVDPEPTCTVGEEDVIHQTGIPSDNYQITTELAEGIWYWKVRARDNAGNIGPWSSPRHFRVDITPPLPPMFVWPADGENTNDNTPNLNWNPVIDQSMPVTYDLDASWLKRRPITISGTHPENYQLYIVVPYDNDMRSDYGDLRFMENGGSGELSYWIENYTADNAKVWVRRVENSDNTIYVYYGGPTAESVENVPEHVFWFYDNFDGVNLDLSKWDNSQLESTAFAIVESGVLKLYGTGDETPPLIHAKCGQLENFAAEFISKRGGSQAQGGLVFNWDNIRTSSSYGSKQPNNAYLIPYRYSTTNNVLLKFTNGTYYGSIDYDTSYDAGTVWQTHLLMRYRDNLEWKVNGSLRMSVVKSFYSLNYFGLQGRGYGSIITYIDNLKIRKYVSPEPTTSVGEEEGQTRITDDNYRVTTELTEGIWYWKVRTVDNVGNVGVWSSLRSFRVDITPPSTPTLLAPVDKTKTYDNTPTFRWTAITIENSLPITYDLQVDNDNNFLSSEVNVTSLTDNTYTSPSELANGNYSWRVRARDNAGNTGAWSQPWSLLINSTPHDATITLTPVNSKPGISIYYMLTVTDNATGDNIDNVTLDIPLDENGNALYRVATPIPAPTGWTPVVPEIDNLGYARKVRWWTDNAWAHIAAGDSENFNFTATTPLYDGVYTWTCRTKDVINYVDNDSFTTRVDNVPPDAPTLLEPDDGAKTTDNTPTFRWTAVTDNSLPVTYAIQVDNDNDFSSPEINVSGLTDITYTSPAVLADDNYSWRVRATDNAGNLSPFSSTWTLTIATVAVEVSISPSYQSGLLGENLDYIVTVANIGNVDDNYELTVTDNAGWTLTLSDNLLENVPAGENRTSTLRVTIPDNASGCTQDNVTVTATSQADNMVKDNASCIAHVQVVRGVEVIIEPESQFGVIGENVILTVTVKNTGNVWENYKLENSDDAGWSLMLDNDYLEIPKSENRETKLIVSVPDNENIICTTDNIIVVATAVDNAEVTDNDNVTVHAVPPWTGTATFSLENLYKVNLYKDNLWLYDGRKLVVKFYTYDNVFEDESVIHENFALPWRVVPENENVAHPSENIGVKKAKLWLVDAYVPVTYVNSYENTKGRVENFPSMQENNSATYATLIERAHSGTYAQENPILNGTFPSSAASWTYWENDPKGFASGSYDGSDGNPPPGSDKGSYGFRYQDTDGAYQIHYFRADYKTVNTVTARWLGETLTGAPSGVIDRPSVPPGITILVDEWTTDQLGINKILAGLWTFKYWGFRTSEDNTGSAELLVDIYRRTSSGTLMQIADKVAAAPLTTDLSEVTGTYYMSEEGMSADNKDAIVIRIYAKNTSAIAQTVYFYFSFSDWPSRMITTLTVPRTDIMRISQTFTAPVGTYVGNISAKFAFKSDNVWGIENARYKVIYLIRNSTDTSTVRTMYDSGWKTENKAWATYENTIPLGVLVPGTSYIIRVEVQVENPNKWERPRVWVNVDDISLIFTIQRYDMDIGFNIQGVTNNYLEMRYSLDNLNEQFRVWVWDFSTGTWNPRGENLTGIGIASWQDDFEDNNIDGWTTGGNANWATTSGDKHSGTYSARAGDIADVPGGQSTWIKTNVNGPGKLMWWWKVDSEAGWDFLRFYLNENKKSEISGQGAGWQSMNWDIPSGSHEIKFQYDKDAIISQGQDTGWIDDLKLVDPTIWTFWSYRLGENEAQAGQVKLRIVDVDNMAILGTNLLIDFIRVRSESVGNEISKVKGWVTIRDDLWGRLMGIRARWPYAGSAERDALWAELMGIRAQWPYAPATRDPDWVDC